MALEEANISEYSLYKQFAMIINIKFSIILYIKLPTAELVGLAFYYVYSVLSTQTVSPCLADWTNLAC